MFKLLHSKTKYGRGIKILAERTYVMIGLISLKLAGDNTGYDKGNVSIEIWSDTSRDRYTLIIPDDKVESVCERLLEAKRKKEHNAKVAAERITL